jgi:hypothetical protein
MGGCGVAFLGVGVWVALLALFPGADAAGVIAMGACAWLLWTAWSAHQGFPTAFRERVIRPLVAFVDASLGYEPSGFIPTEWLRASGLVRGEISYATGSDVVGGTIDGVAIRSAFVRAYAPTASRPAGADPVAPPVRFSGLFVVAEFPKRAAGGVFVFPDRIERLLGAAAGAVQAADRRYGTLVTLEDLEFERLFKVYADDQIEARYVLSPSLMQRLVNFRRRRDAAPRLSIQGATLYVALPSARNPLEPPSWAEMAYTQKSKTGRSLVRRRLAGYVEDLRLIVDVVRDLRLDVRIWGEGAAPGAGRPA